MYKISPNELVVIQHAVCVGARHFLARESIPKAKRLVAGSSNDGFSLGAHGEIQDTVSMAGQRRHHAQRRIFPNADLVLSGSGRESMRRDKLVRSNTPNKVAHLFESLER